ncbi:hypothetical protein FRC11_011442, partial [Ceratobasidium sp. 423]
ILDQQAHIDGSVHAVLRSFIRIRDMVNTTNQASTSMLAAAMDESKETIDGILALLEEVSVYILGRYGTNDLAYITPEDAEVNDGYSVEMYLTRLEELQGAFHSSWSPTATSCIDPVTEVTDESPGM